jgi:hypothetical protein
LNINRLSDLFESSPGHQDIAVEHSSSKQNPAPAGFVVFGVCALDLQPPGSIAFQLMYGSRARKSNSVSARYRAFSDDGNPTLKTVLAVMGTPGLDLTAKAHRLKTKPAARKRAASSAGTSAAKPNRSRGRAR